MSGSIKGRGSGGTPASRARGLPHAKSWAHESRRSSRHRRSLATVFVAACAPQASSPARPRVLSTGDRGVYYVYGGALARVISNLSRVEATAEVTSASIDNLKFLRDGQGRHRVPLADTLKDASEGRELEGWPVDLRALAVLTPTLPTW